MSALLIETNTKIKTLKYPNFTLTGVAQWVGHRLEKGKVTGSVPGWGTCLGCGPGPQMGTWERQSTDVSLCFSLSPSPFLLLSLESINKIFFKKSTNFIYIQLDLKCLSRKTRHKKKKYTMGYSLLNSSWNNLKLFLLPKECVLFNIHKIVARGESWSNFI